MKWRPDYDIAADEYNKAATCFRLAKAFDQCKESLIKSGECHKLNKSWYHAAKCLEQVKFIQYKCKFVSICLYHLL